MAFFQTPPETPDLYEADAALKSELRRRLPEETLQEITPRLRELGQHTSTTLVRLSEQAEREVPVHVPYSAFGRRIDDIRTSPAWDELKRFSAEHGIVSTGYEESLGDRRRVVQAALIHLFSASSATYSCPLAMTDAAARVLLEVAPPELRDRLFPRLVSRDVESFITSGQWMTERTGGSDVGNTETVARPIDESGPLPRYALYGTKWFTSATTSEMALTLARIDDGESPAVKGSRGLSLFCVEIGRDEHGALRGIEVNRLKDKLGTKALPTAELTLNGVEAIRLGEVGRGVATIATMLNVTRFYNAVSSVSGMARATFMAKDYASRRSAFGKRLIEHPLHRRTLADLEAETAAALAMCFELADLLGKHEAETATDAERARLRGLIPIAKLTLGKQAVWVASEALECFGGAGYIEDTGLPRLLRDAQVLSIWEGTTNVLSLDVLRAETKEGALRSVLQDLVARSEKLPADLDPRALEALQDALSKLSWRVRELGEAGDRVRLEEEARRIALTTGLIAEAIFMGETTAYAGDEDPAAKERFADFVRLRLMGPLA